MKKPIILLIFLFLPTLSVFTQETQIKGKVFDENKKPLANILISVLSVNGNILAYQYSNNEGVFTFSVEIENTTPIFLKASSFFFEEQLIRFDLSKKNLFFLKPKVEELNEVIVSSAKVNRDTVSLKINKYNIKETESVEKTLKRIPGISVDKDGRIKYWNKEIEKILIDGDDLADKQYTFISKNLRSEVLDDIQVLKNFEENTVFKKSRESDKIALNLKIKKSFKNIWFGNLSLGYGNSLSDADELKATSNTGLIKKKIKFLNSVRLSTLGDKSIPTFLENDNFYNYDPIYNLKKHDVLLPAEITNFNKAFNDTFLINKKINNLVFRSTNFIGIDKQEQLSFSSTDFFFQAEDSFLENYSNNDRKTLIFGEFELKHQGLKRSYFVNKFRYKIGLNKFSSSSIFKTSNVDDFNKSKEVSFHNNFQFTHRFKSGIISNSEINLGVSNLDENTVVNSSDLITLIQVSSNEINQKTKNKINYFDLKTDFTYLLNRKLKSNFLVSFKNSQETFDITFIPEDLQYKNDVRFERNELNLKPSLIWKIAKKMKLKGNINPSFFGLNNQNKFLFNYNALLSLNYWGNLNLSFSKKQVFPKNQNFLQNYYLTNNSTFRRGRLVFEPIDYSLLKLKLNNRNRKSTYNNEFSFTYKKSNASLLNEFSLLNNINFNNTYLVQRVGEEYVFKNQLIFLVKSIGFKIETTQSFLSIPLNNQNLEGQSKIYDGLYSFELTSYFSSSLNFNVKFEYANNTQTYEDDKSQIDSKNITFDFDWNLNKELTLQLNGGVYELDQNLYKIANLSLNYVPENKKFSYNLTANNLLNEDEFSFQERNTFFSSKTTIPLVPFYIYANVKYIF